MRLAAEGKHYCWTVGFERFLRPATEIFDERVSGTLDGYDKPEFARERARYEAIIDRELARLYRVYRFDAVIAPSDTFFWIRAITRRCQALGIPMIILQKEPTLPPGWLAGPAEEWGRACPFIADHMLVSSDHHRQFWLNAGVEPEKVTVTGQPRFDVYAQPERTRSWADLGVDLPDKPTVLFLTYDSSVYLPMIDRTGHHPWRELRGDTERVLLDIADRGLASVLIKAHPQPSEDQSSHLEELTSRPNVHLLDAQGDVRQYIKNADVVVSFQTTTIFEALGAQVPVVYTWWTEPTRQYEADLTPFHEETEALDVARSPSDLRAAVELRLAEGPSAEGADAARELVTRFVGAIDGHAADRGWSTIESFVRSAPSVSSAARCSSSAGAGAYRWPSRQRRGWRRGAPRLPGARWLPGVHAVQAGAADATVAGASRLRAELGRRRETARERLQALVTPRLRGPSERGPDGGVQRAALLAGRPRPDEAGGADRGREQ